VGGVGFGILACLVTYAAISFLSTCISRARSSLGRAEELNADSASERWPESSNAASFQKS